MSACHRALAELALAGVALFGAAVSWQHAALAVAVGPVGPGQPVTISVLYKPPLVLLSLLLIAIAGVLAVVGTARLRRVWRNRKAKGN